MSAGIPVSRHSLAWTGEEERQLRAEFEAGADLRAIALAHERTPGAICGRLVQMRLLMVYGSSYYPVRTAPWATFESVRKLMGTIDARSVAAAETAADKNAETAKRIAFARCKR